MSVLDAVRKRRISLEERSQRGQDFYRKRVEGKAREVKGILSGDNPNAGVPVEVVALRDLYYYMLESYTRKREVFGVRMNARSVSMWTRVEKAQKRSGCSQERFLKAQFDWFHKTFGKAPEPLQLATDGAVERACAYEGRTEGRHVSNDVRYKTTKADKFMQNEKLLQKMMSAQKCTREEFYRRFVLTGLYSFDPEFLKADPVYRKVQEDA